MDPQQQFCLKWNSYSSNLAITFSNLFKSDVLADVTLSCDGTVFKAHKLILAACSKKFAELFESTPTNGQCVVILEATSSDNMAALLEFMYKGEVHVSQEALNSFLKSAENLQVKGLSTETGRLAAQQQAHQHNDASPLESPNSRRSLRNSISGGAGNISAVGGSPLTSIGGIPSGAIIGGNIAATMAGNAERNSNSGGNGGIGAGSGVSGGIGCNIISGPITAHCNITAPGAGVTGGGGGGPGGPGGMGSGAGVVHHLSSSSGNLKQECDSLMQSSTAAALAAGIPPYVPPIYRPLSFEPLRKRVLRSPYAEQEVRGSVLRDGSKNSSSECASPISKPPYHRPSSSASSNAPTEADTMQSERTSPGRYENHSPGATAGNGSNAPSNLSTSIDRDRSVKTERNNGSTHEANDDDRSEHDESIDQNGAEDLRVKLENSNYSPPPPQPPTSNASSTTPSALLENLKNAEAGLPSNLATSIAPEDMLNVWNATKLNNKNSGMVNTADGKKLKCLYCDRLYGYETNLRAHIRQRHQGIRVHCPFCSRTFTRNNTVRRHIAREHKQEIGLSAASTGIVPASVAAAAAAAAANHSQ